MKNLFIKNKIVRKSRGARSHSSSSGQARFAGKKRLPLVSVVMPVYNAARFLPQAINSVLKQTFRDFEFIIVDDASTDESFKVIERFGRRSRRIKVLRNEKRMGVSITVKRAIDEARGEYIARMDADDICYARRFEKQIAYIKKHPKTVAVTTKCLLIDRHNRVVNEKNFPALFEKIYNFLYRFIPLKQSSFMIAKKRLPYDFEYYNDSMKRIQELSLIFRLFKYGRVETIDETLLKCRIHDNITFLTDVREAFLLTLSYLSKLFLAVSK